MFKTNAEMRRFLMLQKKTYPDCPERVWDRYSIYVEAIATSVIVAEVRKVPAAIERPKTLNEWLGDGFSTGDDLYLKRGY